MKRITWVKLIFTLLLSGALLSACMKPDPVPSAEELLQQQLALVDTAQLKIDVAIIDDSLAMWDSTAIAEPHGVRYHVIKEGTGPKPVLTSVVRVNYRGMVLKNRSVFDQGSGIDFQLSSTGLIAGWKTTLPLINAGSKAVLYIPSGLAYKNSDHYADGTLIIPANSNLIFEIEILNVYN